MSNTVIVPLDGSQTSEQALPFAQLLAEREGARVVLMTVLEISSEFGAWVETAPVSLEEDLRSLIDERQEYLRGHAERFGPETETLVRVGRPAEQIRDVVDEFDDPLLVMASHGRGGIQQFVLGSVALKVVQDVHTPVVVVRIQEDVKAPDALDSLLVPLDGSAFSAQIIDEALAIASEPRPRIYLVSVLEAPSWAAHAFNAGLVGQYVEATREMHEEQLKSVAERLTADGYEVEWSLRTGNAGDQIVAAAEEHGASMIAMATHGRGGLGRLLLGSVAQRVLNRATVPLLLVRPKDE